MHTKILFILCIFSFTYALAQPKHPDDGTIFDDSTVPVIKIYITQAYLDSVYTTQFEDNEYPATFVFTSGDFTQTFTQIGFRLRGNTSRNSGKKSFKVSFNTFVSGRKFLGLEKLNLNGEHNDPCIMRSKIAWEMAEQANIPAPRSNHTELYINDEYMGVYINTEHIDENYVRLRYGNNNGNLYKCLYPADFNYRSSDPNSYKFTDNAGNRVYDLKINEDEDDYSDLAQLIYVVNKTPLADLPNQLEPIFNVNAFLKYLAYEVCTGHWDGYSFNKNNYYLYHNIETGRFEFIPYDADNTYGIDWFNVDWGTRAMYSWYNNGEPRPLTKRILQVPEYRARYSYYMQQLNTLYAPENWTDRIFSLRALIAEPVSRDTYRSNDYGWSYDDFMNSYTTALGQHVKYGFINFITQRHASTLAQIESQAMSPLISDVQHQGLYAADSITIKAVIEDDKPGFTCSANYTEDDGNSQWKPLLPTGQDYIHEAVFLSAPSSQKISYYLSCEDSDGQYSRQPAQGVFEIELIAGSHPQLYINELMANNTYVAEDEDGRYNDWIELYNGSDDKIWLGDKYMSDNSRNRTKWKLPDYNMPAHSFLLVWADEEPFRGEMHTNFSLSEGGEELFLIQKPGNIATIIDSVSFPAQKANVSFGRAHDGTGAFSFRQPASPGESNNVYTSSGLYGYETSQLRFLSNSQIWIFIPTQQTMYLNIVCYDLLGREIIQKNQSLTQGEYIIQLPEAYSISNTLIYNIKIINSQYETEHDKSLFILH